MRIQRRDGFSLVEIMIVVGIVALLSVIAVPAGARALRNAEDARAEKELQSIYTAIVTFQANNNFRFPISWDELNDYISIANMEERYELNTES